ncbi:hypothetical protein CHS0354_030357 [Potamilus streckersoni]|uniref:CARD domain-containing protein n=1 Tax=Potamilus streckersoni TaxID=2493646 RepID=A0AAE0T4B7_9BIVA|nr:hypothetical protein CHS0354_030357 [Potamilus streckersoni]
MATESVQLSNRQELVEGLDTEQVFDYLIQHGVLDTEKVTIIREEETQINKNIILLKFLEGAGSTALALFINALRQSGQLRLASSIDESGRIKPVVGSGYWEKPRYKGQIRITYRLDSALFLVPKGSAEMKSKVNGEEVNMFHTPCKQSASFHNLTQVENTENGATSPRKMTEYSYDTDDEDVTKRSCLCFPIFCKSKKRKKKEKVYSDKADITNKVHNDTSTQKLDVVKAEDIQLSQFDDEIDRPSQYKACMSPAKSRTTLYRSGYSPSEDKVFDSQAFSMKVSSLDRNSNHQLNELSQRLTTLTDDMPKKVMVVYSSESGEISLSTDCERKKDKKSRKNKKKMKNDTDNKVGENNRKNKDKSGAKNGNANHEKESDPYIYDLTSKRSSAPSSSSSSMPSSPTGKGDCQKLELVPVWINEGDKLQEVRTSFFGYIDDVIQKMLLRYFEQERGTLVLDICHDDCLSVCNICMTTKQVQKVLEDYESGMFHQTFQNFINPQDIVDKLDCCGVHLHTVLDEQEIKLAIQELC